MQRCHNPNSDNYPNYGGRGITVTPEWHQFENFYTDIEHIYDPKLTIDRIDNDGNYEPGNVRFVTKAANLRNRRNSMMTDELPQDQSITELAQDHGIHHMALYQRLNLGWTLEDALSKPVKEYSNKGKTRGKYQPRLTEEEYNEIMDMHDQGMSKNQIAKRTGRARTNISRIVSENAYRYFNQRRMNRAKS